MGAALSPDQRNWLVAGAAVLAAHGGVLAALALAGVRLPVPPVPEPVVLVELPPLPPPPAQPLVQQQVQPNDTPQPATPLPPSLAPRIEAPNVAAPLPREVVSVQPPQPAPTRAAAPSQPSAPAASAPAPAAASEAAGDDPRSRQQEADYRSLVYSHISRNRFRPPESRREGLSGEIGVRFIINRSGTLSQVTLARSSGHELLDREAVEFIRRIATVPAFPRDLRRSEIPLTITLRFALERR